MAGPPQARRQRTNRHRRFVSDAWRASADLDATGEKSSWQLKSGPEARGVLVAWVRQGKVVHGVGEDRLHRFGAP
jgi:hypothetical protein